ncbi:14620_t:CDS:2, partial [Cetraspora pellucida]
VANATKLGILSTSHEQAHALLKDKLDIRTAVTASMNNTSPDTRSKFAMNKHKTRSIVKNRSNSMASAESTDTVKATVVKKHKNPNIRCRITNENICEHGDSSSISIINLEHATIYEPATQSISIQGMTSKQFTNQLDNQLQATETRRESGMH